MTTEWNWKKWKKTLWNEVVPMLNNRRLNVIKVVIYCLPNWWKCNEKPIKIVDEFCKNWQADNKIHREIKETENKKEWNCRIILSVFKAYCQVSLIKIRIEGKKINSHIYNQLLFNNMTIKFNENSV